MLEEGALKTALCAELDLAVTEISTPEGLAERVRQRYRQRKRRRIGAIGVAAAAIVGGASLVSALETPQPKSKLPTIDLAGYSVALPSGVHASELHFTSAASSSEVPSSSILDECKVRPLGVLYNHLASWGTAPYNQPTSSNFAITSPSGSGCISGLMTLPYGTGTAPTPDLVAPAGSTTVKVPIQHRDSTPEVAN